MTKVKKPSGKPAASTKNVKPEASKKAPKKSYMVDDEDEELDLDPIEDDDDVNSLDEDPDDNDIVVPKTFDPFDDDDDEDDF
jgi:hypothetical protein